MSVVCILACQSSRAVAQSRALLVLGLDCITGPRTELLIAMHKSKNCWLRCAARCAMPAALCVLRSVMLACCVFSALNACIHC